MNDGHCMASCSMVQIIGVVSLCASDNRLLYYAGKDPPLPKLFRGFRISPDVRYK